eukprot:TRINITY_DN1700_c0_g1_i1.p1 TRINITY_DN1700_c0_g1~~TRINITY_DN1700_c0_g1_i1.p1  ORF type:complete len:757 (-),score=189.13 TRINITY_DN1700_c0_g1_i1:51-2273(-)
MGKGSGSTAAIKIQAAEEHRPLTRLQLKRRRAEDPAAPGLLGAPLSRAPLSPLEAPASQSPAQPQAANLLKRPRVAAVGEVAEVAIPPAVAPVVTVTVLEVEEDDEKPLAGEESARAQAVGHEVEATPSPKLVATPERRKPDAQPRHDIVEEVAAGLPSANASTATSAAAPSTSAGTVAPKKAPPKSKPHVDRAAELPSQGATQALPAVKAATCSVGEGTAGRNESRRALGFSQRMLLQSQQPLPEVLADSAPSAQSSLASALSSPVKRPEASKGPEQTLAELLTLSAPAATTKLTSAADGPSWQGVSRARLLCLELHDFKSFRRKTLNFDDSQALLCLIGANSSGKSALLDALRFVLLRQCDRSPRSFIRRGKPVCSAARVLVRFSCESVAGGAGGTVSLVREVQQDREATGPKAKDAFKIAHWVSHGDSGSREVSEEGYRAWLARALRLADGDLLLPQFGLAEGHGASKLLAQLPAALEKLGADSAVSGPLLKRRTAKTPERQASTPGGSAARAEAWLARRVDEIYRELSREPLDDKMEEWGEGGQACLRRLDDGSFDLLTSTQRGAAACGYGTSLGSLSDGDRDICALSLLFALPGLSSGLQDSLPPLVVLDEPDSRLDKRHACALRRFLAGPSGPKQCLWMSLNNHAALEGDIVLNGSEVEDSVADCDGLDLLEADASNALEQPAATRTAEVSRRDVIKARFLRQMSARLSQETEADLEDEDEDETVRQREQPEVC